VILSVDSCLDFLLDRTDTVFLLDRRPDQTVSVPVVWSPDGKRIASGSLDNTIRIWDAHFGLRESIPKELNSWYLFSYCFICMCC